MYVWIAVLRMGSRVLVVDQYAARGRGGGVGGAGRAGGAGGAGGLSPVALGRRIVQQAIPQLAQHLYVGHAELVQARARLEGSLEQHGILLLGRAGLARAGAGAHGPAALAKHTLVQLRRLFRNDVWRCTAPVSGVRRLTPRRGVPMAPVQDVGNDINGRHLSPFSV